MRYVDLRSDTVTRPTAGMREAMARAEVGDDVYREDPSVAELEATVAALLGKEQALFVPSGTMANQIALLLHTQPGDEVIAGEGAHLVWYESGAGAALSGVQFVVAGSGGLFGADDVAAAIKPLAYYHPRSRLVALENTHNRAGGRVFPAAQCRAITELARARGLATHLDGARLWNAAARTGLDVAVLAEPFDTVSVCFSKGLGAPVGSAIAGSREHVLRALRLRKMLGGGMRQAGVLAQAALYALRHQRERLVLDHEAAANVARIVEDSAGEAARVRPPETNIVQIELMRAAPERVIELAREQGVLVSAMSARTLRAVTHLDASGDDAIDAARRLGRAIQLASAEAE